MKSIQELLALFCIALMNDSWESGNRSASFEQSFEEDLPENAINGLTYLKNIENSNSLKMKYNGKTYILSISEEPQLRVFESAEAVREYGRSIGASLTHLKTKGGWLAKTYHGEVLLDDGTWVKRKPVPQGDPNQWC